MKESAVLVTGATGFIGSGPDQDDQLHRSRPDTVADARDLVACVQAKAPRRKDRLSDQRTSPEAVEGITAKPYEDTCARKEWG
jgi:hypothetical protein